MEEEKETSEDVEETEESPALEEAVAMVEPEESMKMVEEAPKSILEILNRKGRGKADEPKAFEEEAPEEPSAEEQPAEQAEDSEPRAQPTPTSGQTNMKFGHIIREKNRKKHKYMGKAARH